MAGNYLFLVSDDSTFIVGTEIVI
ncbi:hypothetical protein FPZ43_11205 [Mucilaginibacter pallidiroseus]|uniref:Uncharacterized protein n=1 Tax=Mucilaginibacter pallidiroseus TaxID=2599295 RepID=A0A563UCK6_9SPHI|nr:hypothetical protein FPZ43_11205 [Mucilaginibacter pallidiroseus]